jgi:ABC-type transporter Mla subunit MlaD
METLSDEELGKRLDHLDDGIHAIQQRLDVLQEFIDEHRPALARGLSLMDPGAKLRTALGMKAKDSKHV